MTGVHAVSGESSRCLFEKWSGCFFFCFQRENKPHLQVRPLPVPPVFFCPPFSCHYYAKCSPKKHLKYLKRISEGKWMMKSDAVDRWKNDLYRSKMEVRFFCFFSFAPAFWRKFKLQLRPSGFLKFLFPLALDFVKIFPFFYFHLVWVYLVFVNKQLIVSPLVKRNRR